MTLPSDTRLRAYVLEDEPHARRYLVELLTQTGQVTVVGESGSADEAAGWLAATTARPEPEVDVVFVDVQIRAQRSAGLDLVRRFVAAEGAPSFVLCTAFQEHALEAFELGVVDYLHKPLREDRVRQCVERLLARRAGGGGANAGPGRVDTPTGAAEAPRKLVARSSRGLLFLTDEETWAFEASDRLTYVHGPHGRRDIDLTLATIERELGPAVMRVHRNWLVRPRFVRELARDGSELELWLGPSSTEPPALRVPVARDRAPRVREALLAETVGASTRRGS